MGRAIREEYFRYFPVGDRERRWGLYVTAVGRLVQAMPGRPHPGHPSPYYYVWEKGRVLSEEYGVHYITQGEGEFESEQAGLQAVTAGDIMVLFPGVWHRYRPANNRAWTYYWVHFGGSYVDSLVSQKFVSPDAPILKVGVKESLLHPYLSMIDCAHTEPPGYAQLMSGCILQLLGSALATADNQAETGSSNDIARQAVLAMEKAVEEAIDMRRLAASFHLSYDRFRHIFRQHVGQPPQRYLRQLRIRRAKELLSGTELSVKEIGAVLQFDDSYHFSRVFKETTGMAPSQWRGKSHRGRRERPPISDQY